MIILPDKNIPHTRFLMPLSKQQWRTSSQAQLKDQLGNENTTRFKIEAKLNDGFLAWKGWFDDREDFDVFLFSILNKTLPYEKELWDLPNKTWTPQHKWSNIGWLPDIGENLNYVYAATTFLTTTGSNQTYARPSDWNSVNNKIECLGGAGSGGISNNGNGNASGGGGGAYSAITNFTFDSSGTATYRVGSGGSSVATGGATAGNAGGQTWFNDTVNPGVGTTNEKCSADNGKGGETGRPANGGAGGAASSSWGQTKYSGGRGGNATTTTGICASGGGGAAGPAGAGGNGGDISAIGSTDGGSANNGTTAGGRAGSGAIDGGSGTEFGASYGCGSGSGGYASPSANTTSGNGGNYGGASGGASAGSGLTGTSGAGRQGLIVVTYTPASYLRFNMPMLGL